MASLATTRSRSLRNCAKAVAPTASPACRVRASSNCKKQVQLRALIITPQGRAVQLFVRGAETITVMDKELIDLGSLGTFLVHIERDGVTLYNPSLPQGKKVVLR